MRHWAHHSCTVASLQHGRSLLHGVGQLCMMRKSGTQSACQQWKSDASSMFIPQLSVCVLPDTSSPCCHACIVCLVQRDAQLGDGVQEVVPGLQAADLLRQCQGAQSKAPGLEQATRLPRVHHQLHTRAAGRKSERRQAECLHHWGVQQLTSMALAAVARHTCS